MVTGISFQVKVAVNSLAEFIDFTFGIDWVLAGFSISLYYKK